MPPLPGAPAAPEAGVAHGSRGLAFMARICRFAGHTLEFVPGPRSSRGDARSHHEVAHRAGDEDFVGSGQSVLGARCDVDRQSAGVEADRRREKSAIRWVEGSQFGSSMEVMSPPLNSSTSTGSDPHIW